MRYAPCKSEDFEKWLKPALEQFKAETGLERLLSEAYWKGREDTYRELDEQMKAIQKLRPPAELLREDKKNFY